MFGFYELQLPAALQSSLSGASNRMRGGTFWGVLAMGVLSAVIVGPCVAAPLAGALLYINQTRDAVLGGTALFAMALGMGVPLLAVGASAGALLPRAGAWMQTVKNFFGVVLLGLAIWIVSPILPGGGPHAPVGRAADLCGDLPARPRSAAAQRLRLSEAVEGRGRDRAPAGGGPAGRCAVGRPRHPPAAGRPAQRRRCRRAGAGRTPVRQSRIGGGPGAEAGAGAAGGR